MVVPRYRFGLSRAASIASADPFAIAHVVHQHRHVGEAAGQRADGQRMADLAARVDIDDQAKLASQSSIIDVAIAPLRRTW